MSLPRIIFKKNSKIKSFNSPWGMYLFIYLFSAAVKNLGQIHHSPLKFLY